jgi:hypothetical protein
MKYAKHQGTPLYAPHKKAQTATRTTQFIIHVLPPRAPSQQTSHLVVYCLWNRISISYFPVNKQSTDVIHRTINCDMSNITITLLPCIPTHTTIVSNTHSGSQDDLNQLALSLFQKASLKTLTTMLPISRSKKEPLSCVCQLFSRLTSTEGSSMRGCQSLNIFSRNHLILTD